MNSKLFITGVSGFVGRNVAKYFIRQGYLVQGISRTDPEIDGLDWHYGDITVPDSLPSYVDGHIIHCAALPTDGHSAAHHRINAEGTLNVASIASSGKLIHISSSSVYNLTHASRNVSEIEFSPFRTTYYNSYGKSKAKAEEIIFAANRKQPSIILRPHAIYGNDDTTLLPKLEKRLRKKLLVLPGSGNIHHSLTHVNNLIHAIECALHSCTEKTEAFNITDKSPVQLKEAISALIKPDIHFFYIPTSLALFAAHHLSHFSEYEIRQIGMTRTYDINKARTILQYNPTSFTENQ